VAGKTWMLSRADEIRERKVEGSAKKQYIIGTMEYDSKHPTQVLIRNHYTVMFATCILSITMVMSDAAAPYLYCNGFQIIAYHWDLSPLEARSIGLVFKTNNRMYCSIRNFGGTVTAQ